MGGKYRRVSGKGVPSSNAKGRYPLWKVVKQKQVKAGHSRICNDMVVVVVAVMVVVVVVVVAVMVVVVAEVVVVVVVVVVTEDQYKPNMLATILPHSD